ncbi:glucosyltransferase domain-containing protein [Thiorhodococcus fuscus]|uniref:Glucosyltransferase domain-containing protein n=1 Tax=Thiorhodococcus fuscus TaxID=527200 RepID=A0ABW4Y885_9GAMM
MEQIETANRKALNLTQDDLRILSYLFLIFFVLYAYEITNFNVSIDDEILAYRSASGFVDLGRWLFPLIRESFWPQIITPFGPYILFGLCIALGYLYILRALGIFRPTLFHYSAFAAFILFPIWPAQLEFNGNVIPLGVATVAISASALLASRPIDKPFSKSILHIIAPAALISIAAGAYQSSVLIYPIVIIGRFLQDRLPPTLSPATGKTRHVIAATSAFLLGCVFYLAIAALAMKIYGMPPSSYGSSFVNINTLFSVPQNALSGMMQNLWNVYFAWWKPFGTAAYAIPTAIVTGAAIALHAARDSWRTRVWVSLGLLFILASPAAFCLLSGHELPLRTLLGAPFALLVLLILFYHSTDSGRIRKAALAAALLIALEGLYIQSIHQARSALAQKHDMLFASAINTDILRTPNLPKRGPITIDFSGAKKFESVYPALPTTTAGASFFEWDGGNPHRMTSYMNLIGYHRYVEPDNKTRARMAPHYSTMPEWPLEGSIKVVDGVVLIKISDK